MSENIKATIHKELINNCYAVDDDFSITVSFKETNRWKVDLFIELIKNLEGWDFEEYPTITIL